MITSYVVKIWHFLFIFLFFLSGYLNSFATIGKEENPEFFMPTFVIHKSDSHSTVEGTSSALDSESYQKLLDRANAGDLGAQHEIVIRRYNRKLPKSYNNRDIDLGVWSIFEPAAEDDFYAYFVLTLCSSDIIEAQCPELIANMQQRAHNDNVLAQTNLGFAYYGGRGVVKNHETAAFWFQKAADLNYSVAQSQLGELYLSGKGVDQSYDEAAHWLIRAADLGYASAQNHLAGLYLRGEGVNQSDESAFEYYQKAANKENALAQTNLALAYLNGRGVAKDIQSAFYWLQRSANQGYGFAQYWLGILYFKGQDIQQNYDEAFALFKLAAEQGNTKAQYWLGGLYLRGDGVKKNADRAAYWFEQAALKGDANAQNYLGGMYLRGEGVKKNYQTALYWYEKAADQNHAAALNNLGDLYLKSCCVQQSYTAAANYFERAAKLGLPVAIFNLGRLYFYGYGVQQDVGKALNLWLDAASKGNPESMQSLRSVLKLRILPSYIPTVDQQRILSSLKQDVADCLAECEAKKQENVPLVEGVENKLAIPQVFIWEHEISELITELQSVLLGLDSIDVEFLITCLIPSQALKECLCSENSFFQQELLTVPVNDMITRYEAFLSMGKHNVAGAKPVVEYYRSMDERFEKVDTQLEKITSAYKKALEFQLIKVLVAQAQAQQKQLNEQQDEDPNWDADFQAAMQEEEMLQQLLGPKIQGLQKHRQRLSDIRNKFKQLVVDGASQRNFQFLQKYPFLTRNVRP